MADQLKGTASLKEPLACTEAERREFEQFVRRGFVGSDGGLYGRILDARLLAFHYTTGGTLVAIAGLKVPTERYRTDVFKKADDHINAADYNLELGWVFVVTGHRGNRIATGLCRQLLARVPSSNVFATTRPDNTSMIRILLALGFSRAGKPFPRRNEELLLYIRPGPTSPD